MSDLPNGWMKTTLANIALIEMGQSPDSRSYNSEGIGLPFFQGKAEFQSVFPEIRKWCSDPTKIVEGGDILLSIRAPVGPTNIAPERSCIGRGLAGLRGESGINQHYLFYFLRNIEPWLSEQGTGSTFAAISGQFVKDIDISIAPTAEQTRIVDKLEELLSDLDAGVVELKAAQKKLMQYRQSLLKAAVEGGLTVEWRAQNVPTETGAQLLERILTERRTSWEAKQLAKFKEQSKIPPKDWQKKYPEPVQPDTTDLPELPEGWVWASVEQLGHVQLGRQRSPSKIGKANPTPYIRAANITEGGVDLSDVLEMEFSETEKKTFALKVGDVLLTEASGSPEHVGRPAIWKHAEGLYCFQNTVLRFSPEGIGSEYAFYLFLAMQKLGVFSKLSGGVGINHLSAGKFSKLPVPFPPVAEQLALIEILKASFSRIDDQLAFNAHSLKQSAAQRQNILSAAFAGQLVPQDPNDEPASVLLERIRVERAERVKQPKERKTKQQKEIAAVMNKLIDVLAEAGDWVPAQEAFQRCGVADGAETDQVEALYAELRALDKAGRLAVEAVTDTQGRKLHDRLKLLAT